MSRALILPSHLRGQANKACKLYEDFTGHEAELVGKIDIPKAPKIVLAFGDLIDIGYVTVRDGRTERYRHQFSAASRPLLASSFDGKQFFILGGEYDFTERGIVDRKR